MKTRVQLGIDSFVAAHNDTSHALSPTQRLRNLIDQIEHADQVELDVFGIGEHHRKDFLDSAPAVILGAAAARTSRIRLTSVVTVLSSADPVGYFRVSPRSRKRRRWNWKSRRSLAARPLSCRMIS